MNRPLLRNVKSSALIAVYLLHATLVSPYALPDVDASNTALIALFPSASDATREGFVRVINRSDEAGEVRVAAIDDTGVRIESAVLNIGSHETVHFNSGDLEGGAVHKGLSGGTGPGEGDWRLKFSTDLDIEVLAYIRTTDGFLTAMHDVVERGLNGHRVAIFNPGRNSNQVSLLRLINPGEAGTEVAISGIDDAGMAGSGSVTVTLPPRGARTVPAAELESVQRRGDAPDDAADESVLAGELGTGAGKWQLLVTSEHPVVVMSLLTSPTGHLTNLSTAPYRLAAGAGVIRQVAENTEAGAAIGDAVTADFGGAAERAHVLEGTDAASFDIESSTGQLLAKAEVTYDFESRITYLLTVKVTDALAGMVRIPVTVEVTDVDEPPERPEPPEVEGVSSRSVLVTWAEPVNTGPEITDYDVEYRREGAQDYTDAQHEGIERELEITHLRQRADYEFRVRASNDEGVGEWSGPTLGRARAGGGGGGGGTVSPPPPPPPPPPMDDEPPVIDDPRSFTVDENDPDIGRVRASDPNRGDSILGFTIIGGADEALVEIDANGNLSFIKAPDHERPEDRFSSDPPSGSQDNEHIVEIEVQSGAPGRVMTGTAHIAVTVTDIDEPPLRPDPPAVEDSTLDSLSIHWQPPVNTGPPITDYDYRYRVDRPGENWTQVFDTTITATRVTLTDLDEETDYEIQIRATNEEGTGVWSRSAMGRTRENRAPVFREGSRTVRSVTENTAGTVDLGNPVRADDSDGGTPVYSLEGEDRDKFGIDVNTGQLRTAAGTAYDHEAENEHQVTVRAGDGQGGSATIAVSVDVLDELEPPVSPAQPRVTTVDTGSVAVSWSAPGNVGRPGITGYDIQRRIDGTTDAFLISNRNVRGTNAKVENLDAQTTYEVQVRAKNDEGDGAWSPPGRGMTALTTPEALVVSLTSDPGADGYYKLGNAIEATVTFTEAVSTGGNPQLSLMVDSMTRWANYQEGSGTEELVFAYEVADTDEDDDGVSIPVDALRLNGGTIRKHGYNLDALLTLGARPDNSGHRVDGVKPRLIGLEANGTTVTLTYSEALDRSSNPAMGDFQVTVAGAAGSVTSVTVSGSAVRLALQAGVSLGQTVAVTYTAGTNPIRDPAQNGAAEISSRPATNQTAGVCARTASVREAIVAATPPTACSGVTAEHLAGITYLDLSGENIRELATGDFAGLTGLSSLYLEDNELETLPAGLFSGLPALQLLWLYDNQLNALPGAIFSGLSSLVILDIQNNRLDNLGQEQFSGLTALEQLDLSDNLFESLPTGVFSDLAALVSLDLESNQLSALDAGDFAGLTGLEELDLSHNALETLPESLFGSLKAMTLLDLDGNRLDTLPAGIFAGLTALRTLWVADNELSNLLDTVFSGLSALTWIDLDGNEFTTVPDDLFGGLSNLSKLWLRNNQLNALSADAFSGLTALNELKLDGNPTDPLPVTVGLEATSSGQFKGSVPAGAPFELILPVQVSGGTLSGVATTITIPQGSTGSSSQGASRTPGSKAPVTVDIESLPELPSADSGYELVKSSDLPVEVIAATRGVRIYPTTLTVREDGANRYTAVLNSQPTADATVSVTVPQGTDIEADPTMLTFTPDTWETPQSVEVTAMADTDTTDDRVTLGHAVSGGDYAGLSVSAVSVTVAENPADTNASPSFTSDTEFEVTEHELPVGAVTAQDGDEEDYITGYAVSGGVDAGRFAISGEGVLTFKSAPDFEKPEDVLSTTPANDADNNEYVVTVTATSGTDTREQSATQTITVTVNDRDEPPGRPAAPQVLVFNYAPRNVTVLAARSPLINTGPDITDYDVQYRIKDTGQFREWSHMSDALDATISGLERDTTYEVQVRAINAEGMSDWSPSGEATTPNDAPLPNSRQILSDLTSAVGGAVEIVDIDDAFDEPDNDRLRFTASSSNERVASVQVRKSLLTISPGAAGSATITITGTDPYGAAAMRTFDVTVRAAVLRNPSVDIQEDTLTVEFSDTFAADEVRAYEFRARQKAPRGAWSARCTPVAKPSAGSQSVTLSASLAGVFEPGTVYEVDYGHRGTRCTGNVLARSAVVEHTTAGTGSFDIELLFVGTGITSTLRSAFDTAAGRWSRVITGDIPNVDYSRVPVVPCYLVADQPKIGGVVDDQRVLREIVDNRWIRWRRGDSTGVPHARSVVTACGVGCRDRLGRCRPAECRCPGRRRSARTGARAGIPWSALEGPWPPAEPFTCPRWHSHRSGSGHPFQRAAGHSGFQCSGWVELHGSQGAGREWSR